MSRSKGNVDQKFTEDYFGIPLYPFLTFGSDQLCEGPVFPTVVVCIDV